MTRLADLLRQGTVMKKAIQPYESHMQYLSQWMCDYNLYGCAYIDCSNAKFRHPVPAYLEMNSTLHHWHDRTISASSISDEDKFPRQSHCSIEVDICAQDILNRLDIKARHLHHDFIEQKTALISDEKLVHSMAGLWRDETKRRKARMGEIKPGSSPFPPEVLVSVSADPRNSQPGGWIHEHEFMEKIRAIQLEEKLQNDDIKVNFDSFIQKAPFEGQVKTALESVEDLFPINLSAIKTSQTAPGFEMQPQMGDVIVDESRVLSFEEDELPYDSDEERARDLEISQRRQGDQIDGGSSNENITRIPNHDMKPGDGKTAEHSKDQINSAPPVEPPYPTSSTEFEALGIRVTGDHNHMKEDSFDIPTDFASNISAATKHHRAKALDVDTEPLQKRRKIIHDGPSSIVDVFELHLPSNEEGEIQLLPSDNPSASLYGVEHDRISQSTKAHNCVTDQSHKDHRSKPVNSNLSSQERLSNTKASGNRTLTFPVVKDPQNPATILRLSQRSSSPARSSQNAKMKQTSVDPSAETRSDIIRDFKSGSVDSDAAANVISTQALEVCSRVVQEFHVPDKIDLYCFNQAPPPASSIASMMRNAKIPSVVYQDAFYSDERDVPERAREYAGREFRLESGTVPYLPDFDPTGTLSADFGGKPGIVVDRLAMEKSYQRRRRYCNLQTWEFIEAPPTSRDVQNWLDQHDGADRTAPDRLVSKVAPVGGNALLSQIEGATQKNRHGFKYSQKQNSTSVQHETQYMSTMSLEIHVNTRGNLLPNPEQDEISCVFWCLQSDDKELEVNGNNRGTNVGILVLSPDGGMARRMYHSQQTAVQVEEEATELDLVNRMVDIVRNYDPDILTGYEVHGGSWGYMIERARYKFDYNLCDEFSRMKSMSHGRFGKDNDRWGFNHTSTIRVTGRHMINIWRAMRGELNLLQYTMENVVFHLLHRRIPHFSYQDLTSWYGNNNPRDLNKVIDYYISRVQLDVEILEQNELIPRTSEQARLLGVDFFSVFSRGSQFKVESLMFRIAKPENFLLPSPSRKQVGQQNALECLPLVMEPQSAFYTSPLLVLDFQSLYPSVMIAYNYCYSTFLGRVVDWRGQNKMGFTNYEREQRLLELFADSINVAPNGIMYAKPEIRKSLLAKMLGEILETRVMVKSGMKVDKDDKTLQRLLNNRQLALKLIANVTYGYTSASFSGRMPCSEIADSIVQTGRETLEKAIALIHSVRRWGAEVVYGDTDSLFVYLKGRSKDEAFDIGNDIAKTITDMNPRPVKLKFEKVYLPCVLLAKKRYVGFKYETKAQTEPEFDAKGIETVRRDGTPAEQRIEEKALKILFHTADLSQVKEHFQRQCAKIMQGKVSIQDFCFAKEVKLGTYSDKGPPPPGALISTKRMLEDPRAEPQYGERVPYIVITGAPGARLIDRCVAPDVLLHNDHHELDAEYYISKNLIPPLERIFNLVGANVRQWYDEMPKFQGIRRIETGSVAKGKDLLMSKATLESYMKSSSCLVCREKLEAELPICGKCMQNADISLLTLLSRSNRAEKKASNFEKVCRSCSGLAWGEEIRCDSKDCAVFYTRARHMASLRSAKAVMEPVIKVLEEVEDGALDW